MFLGGGMGGFPPVYYKSPLLEKRRGDSPPLFCDSRLGNWGIDPSLFQIPSPEKRDRGFPPSTWISRIISAVPKVAS